MTLLFLLLLLFLVFEGEGRCWDDLPFLEEEIRECLLEMKNVFGVPSRLVRDQREHINNTER